MLFRGRGALTREAAKIQIKFGTRKSKHLKMLIRSLFNRDRFRLPMTAVRQRMRSCSFCLRQFATIFKPGSFASLWAELAKTMRCRMLNDSEHNEFDGLAGAQTSRNDCDLQRCRHERWGADEEVSSDDFLQ